LTAAVTAIAVVPARPAVTDRPVRDGMIEARVATVAVRPDRGVAHPDLKGNVAGPSGVRARIFAGMSPAIGARRCSRCPNST
jgi:hypothetical protein